MNFHASDAIVFGLKGTVNNLRTALYSALTFISQIIVSLLVLGSLSTLFALWKMPELKDIFIHAKESITTGSTGYETNLQYFFQIPVPVIIVYTIAILFFIILCSMFAAGYLRMIIKFYDTGSVHMREMFMGWHRGIRLLIGLILLSVSVLIGLCLFIIPGIYILIHGLLFPFFIVDKNSGVIDSFRKSFRAVRGHGWQITALLAVSILMSFNPILSLISMFTRSLMLVYAYRHLTS